MFKKLIIVICLFLLTNIKYGIVASEENNLLPLKKPKLTKQELKKKVLINILKPLPKPISKKIEEKTNEIAKEKTIKPKFLLPKNKNYQIKFL